MRNGDAKGRIVNSVSLNRSLLSRFSDKCRQWFLGMIPLRSVRTEENIKDESRTHSGRHSTKKSPLNLPANGSFGVDQESKPRTFMTPAVLNIHNSIVIMEQACGR